MNKYLILVSMIFLFGVLQGTTIIVDIEGNGDYTSIQEGINVSVDGDIVLVYPGRYFENIDFIGKTITVASLEMTTGNRDYIDSTIIDGNQTSCCVYVNNNEGQGTTLRGFTITNGIGHLITVSRRGGGIYTRDACLDIINCIVKNNNAYNGGGISVSGTYLYLEGCTIRNNRALKRGGGLICGRLYSSIEFSDDNRCNIYDNFAPWGQDICNIFDETVGMVTDIIVDTFTVSEPLGFELYQGGSDYIQNYSGGMTLDILQAKYEKIEADLYVAPWGNDENSGLSEAEALYSINKALQLISADNDHPRTVHLTNGLYAPWYESQTFPLVMRSYVSLIGESEENTIIDLQNGNCGFIVDLFGALGYEVKNMTVQNGYLPEDNSAFFGHLSYIRNAEDSAEPLLFENITFRDNSYRLALTYNEVNLTVRDVKFIGNHGEYSNQGNTFLRTSLISDSVRTTLIENCIFQNNNSGTIIFWSGSNIPQGSLTCSVVNCLFYQNEFENVHTPEFPAGMSIVAIFTMNLNIINCTFTGNQYYGPTIGDAPVKVTDEVYATFANNIFYDNDTTHSIIAHSSGNAFPVVVVHHNIIENGLDGILDEGNFVIWDDETNWDVDPLFLGEGDYPNTLQEGSPAIDMGTFNLPEGVELPEYDLAGNPRTIGNGIDLGAYEWQYPDSNDENEITEIDENLIIYPNPFNPSTVIKFNLAEDSFAELNIYNSKGQKVCTLLQEQVSAGTHEVNWNGRNDNNRPVSSGVYYLKLKTNDANLTQKLLLLK